MNLSSRSQDRKGGARFFSKSDIDEFKECFSFYARQRHIVNVEELKIIMRSLGYSPTIVELQTYYKKYQKEGKIDFATFLDIMHEHSQNEKCQEELVAAFQSHDIQRRGYVNASEVKNILTQFGEKLNKREVDALFREAKIQPNGQVKYADFIKTLLTPAPDY
ncbi:calmodulin-like protein 4 isoform X1 [Lingula anatina]|uniref:Calmodulin-like protein 4 isoform X1 n=1 Tax=Lingula anatina TaxID=7574 RepID=A0A1S3I857_LINAN|nr:calmodulin-like protein 4 isoform X1 [Lingula anatina]|eukprot:XP_013394046.1 calmodulin-like protein 4 isoform X1 [Lingula anatina]